MSRPTYNDDILKKGISIDLKHLIDTKTILNMPFSGMHCTFKVNIYLLTIKFLTMSHLICKIIRLSKNAKIQN